jgi:hypothetical protein
VSFTSNAPVPVTATNTTLVPPFGSPVICCVEDRVHIGWSEASSAGASYEPFVRTFAMDGVPLSAAIRLTSELPVGSPGSQSGAGLCCAPGVVHAAWVDARLGPGNAGLYLRSSTDGGVTWSAQSTRMDSSLAPAHGIGYVGGLGCDGAHCVVGWIDSRDAPAIGRADLFVQRTIP